MSEQIPTPASPVTRATAYRWVWQPHAVYCFCDACYWRRYRDMPSGEPIKLPVKA